jgi:pimeloyl-ACP methyl ester carboxylesterase
MQKNKPAQLQSGYAPVNGLKMYYEIYGQGTIPLVLIHGGGSTIETSFANIIPFLAPHHKLIAVELQAHGRTSDREAQESFQQDADDVAALLAHLRIETADILGFSNGGSTTMQIAIRHPQLVHKIIVISGACKRDGMIPGFFDGFKNATLDQMPQPLQDGYRNVAQDPAKLQVMFEKDVYRMAHFTDWSDDDIRSIKAPALIMNADHDVVMPEHALQIARLIPNAQLVILPGVHGEFLGEQCTYKPGSKFPGITAQLIDAFLQE